MSQKTKEISYLAKKNVAGIYFHIPFCKQLCHYCSFHKNISLKAQDDMLECLKRELALRKGYLDSTEISTIYFGGGTPSVYTPVQIGSLIDEVDKYWKIKPDAEITLEANPDDLDRGYLENLSKSPVNRLSIGIQSFHDEDLVLMNRRHTGKESYNSVAQAQDLGFDNISVDLIYGLPGLSMDKWGKNLALVFDLQVQHISSYHLTYEPGTVFAHRLKKGQMREIDEELSFNQFKYLIDEARNHGFTHYEISNFCKDGYISRHNSSYWLQKQYLGIGPSAHSYNLREREWNIAHNTKYIEAIKKGSSFSEKESLGFFDRFNEFVLTSLRTCWGLDLEKVKSLFGTDLYEHCLKKTKKYLKSKHVRYKGKSIVLSDSGVFVSNEIMSDFFWVEDKKYGSDALPQRFLST